MSVLGLDSGYTVKYTPPPSGIPSAVALGSSFMQRVIFDRISLVWTQYGYSVTFLLTSAQPSLGLSAQAVQ